MGNVSTLTKSQLHNTREDQAGRLNEGFRLLGVDEGREDVKQNALRLVNKPAQSTKTSVETEACARWGCNNTTHGRKYCDKCVAFMSSLRSHLTTHKKKGTIIGRVYEDVMHLAAAHHRGEVKFVEMGSRKKLVKT